MSTLTGSVTDLETRQPVALVSVTATSPSLEGEQTVVTDATGLYTIPQLPPGTYTLRFLNENYRPKVKHDIPLEVDETKTVDVELLPDGLGGG